MNPQSSNEVQKDANSQISSGRGPIHIRDPDVAKWTAVVGRWTMALFVAAIVSAGIAFFQWRALDHTDKTLQDTLVAIQRPWVTLNSEPKDRVRIDEERRRASVSLLITGRNIGHTPALNISTHASMFANKDQVEANAAGLQVKLCGDKVFHEGIALFPDEYFTEPHGLFLVPEDTLDIAHPRSPQPGEIFFGARILICADYEVTFGRDVHRTAILYRLEQTGVDSSPSLVRLNAFAD